MTMDVQKTYQSYNDTSTEAKGTHRIESARTAHIPKTEMQATVLNTGKSSKRSFDVAFLMMPDEKLRKPLPEKHIRVSKQLFNEEEWDTSNRTINSDYSNENPLDLQGNIKSYDERIRSNNNISPNFGSENIDVGTEEYSNKVSYCSDSENSDRSRSRPNSNESAARPKFLPESPYKNKIFDDPSFISAQTRARYEGRYLEKHDMSPKSAFTKVANYSMQSRNPSLSPDSLMYQNSVSPPLSVGSPPVNPFNKNLAFNNLLTPAHLMNGNNFFKSQNSNYPETGPRQPPFNQEKTDSKQQNTLNKMTFLPFRSEMPPYLPGGSSYPFSVQSPNPEFIKMPAREPVNPLINPAAAILSTLLPPTLAAFSLPAQNVCAKCNISFRMTSDLVYHMRTHHKSESTADPHRRKREEKLKCPVCNESFRERHHLTRHMTAHQDKEGDLDDGPPQSFKKNKQLFNSSALHK